MRYLLLALLFFTFTPHVNAADWYVCPDTQGEYGTEDGTSLANCYDGFTDAWALAGDIDAGDTLHVCGDFNGNDARMLVSDSGTESSLITISGAPIPCNRTTNSTISRAGVTGTNGRPISASNTGANRAYVLIEDLTISNCSDYCIFWERSTTGNSDDNSTLYVNRVTFNYCGSVAAPGQTCIRKKGAGLSITNSTFDYCYEDCIWTLGKDVTVSNNTFTNISYGTAKTLTDFGLLIGGDAFQFNSVITGDSITNSGYARFLNNYCDHTLMDVKYCALIQSKSTSTEVTVSNNVTLCPKVAENFTASRQCHPIYLDVASTTAVSITGNYTQGGETGIALTASTTSNFDTKAKIIGNVVKIATDRGIWIDSNVNNIDILNNTVAYGAQYGIYHGVPSPIGRVSNNILYRNDVGLFMVDEPTSRAGNLYYGNRLNISRSGVDTSPLSSDSLSYPYFVGGYTPTTLNGFRVHAEAPRGVHVGDYTDITGKYFDYAPTIGAFEAGTRDFINNRDWR